MFNKIILAIRSMVANIRMSAEERYLSEASDLADLEWRMKNIHSFRSEAANSFTYRCVDCQFY